MPSELVYVAVGSNIDPQSRIPACLDRLAGHESLHIVEISSFYESPAEGRPDQSNYRNGIVALTTPLEPADLKFKVLRHIEEAEGRVRTEDKFAPRTIDLDIVLFGDRVIDDPDLKLPDPAIWQYPFVTIPLLEIAPDLLIPGTQERLADRASGVDAGNLVLDAALTQTIRKGIPHG